MNKTYRNDVGTDEQGQLLGDEVSEVHEGRAVGWVTGQHKHLHTIDI